MSNVIEHGGIIFPDADSVFVTAIVPNTNMLSKDMIYKLPKEAGELASLKGVESMMQSITGGDGVVNDSKKLGGKLASEFALQDLSNVKPNDLPQEVIDVLKGTPGSKIYTNTSDPISSLGVDDDAYINTSTGNIYSKKLGIWSKVGSLIGPQGPAGASVKGDEGNPGSKIYTGSNDPATALGVNDDIYVNIVSGNVYSKKLDTWAMDGNIKGPQGPAGASVKGDQGIQGPIGPKGADGAKGATGVGLDKWSFYKSGYTINLKINGVVRTVTDVIDPPATNCNCDCCNNN